MREYEKPVSTVVNQRFQCRTSRNYMKIIKPNDFQLICRMCVPHVFFTRYNALRAHIRAQHNMRDLPDSQISLFENYPGARFDLNRHERSEGNTDTRSESSYNQRPMGRQGCSDRYDRDIRPERTSEAISKAIAEGKYTKKSILGN